MTEREKLILAILVKAKEAQNRKEIMDYFCSLDWNEENPDSLRPFSDHQEKGE